MSTTNGNGHMRFQVPDVLPKAEAWHTPDFTIITWQGRMYHLSPKRAAAVRLLDEARAAGRPFLSEGEILNAIDSDGDRLIDNFRSSNVAALMGSLILRGPGPKTYRLADAQNCDRCAVTEPKRSEEALNLHGIRRELRTLRRLVVKLVRRQAAARIVAVMRKSVGNPESRPSERAACTSHVAGGAAVHANHGEEPSGERATEERRQRSDDFFSPMETAVVAALGTEHLKGAAIARRVKQADDQGQANTKLRGVMQNLCDRGIIGHDDNGYFVSPAYLPLAKL